MFLLQLRAQQASQYQLRCVRRLIHVVYLHLSLFRLCYPPLFMTQDFELQTPFLFVIGAFCIFPCSFVLLTLFFSSLPQWVCTLWMKFKSLPRPRRGVILQNRAGLGRVDVGGQEEPDGGGLYCWNAEKSLNSRLFFNKRKAWFQAYGSDHYHVFCCLFI